VLKIILFKVSKKIRQALKITEYLLLPGSGK